jgi:hypothetical protein
VSWAAALDDLEREIEMLRGADVVIGVVCDESQISLSGNLRAGAKVSHPGAEVSFEVPAGPGRPGSHRLVFHTAVHPVLTHNLRAIGLGLTALRAVDRYGITSSGEQYAGWAQLTAGTTDVERGRELVSAAGGLRVALKRHHPDAGGEAADFAAVDAFRKAFGGRTG